MKGKPFGLSATIMLECWLGYQYFMTRAITAWSSVGPWSSGAPVQSRTGWFESPILGANLGDTGATFSPLVFPWDMEVSFPLVCLNIAIGEKKSSSIIGFPFIMWSCARLKTTLMFRLERYVVEGGKNPVLSGVYLMSASEAFPFVKLFFQLLVMSTSELL